MASNPGMDRKTAASIADDAAPIQALGDLIESRFLLGKLPRFSKVIGAATGGAWKRAGIRATVGLGTEWSLEMMQGLAPHAMQALKRDMPQVDWDRVLGKSFGAENQLQLWSVIVPLTVMGVGSGRVSDFLNGRQLLSDAKLLNAYGLESGAVKEVTGFAAKGEWDNAVAALRTAYANTDFGSAEVQARRVEASRLLKTEQSQHVGAAAEAERLGMIPRIGRTTAGFTLRFEDGNTANFPSYESAHSARVEHLDQRGASAESVYGDMVTQVQHFERTQRVGGEQVFDRTNEWSSAKDFARLNPEQAEAVYNGVRIENTLRGEEAQASERYVLGASRSEFVNGVYRSISRLLGGATAQTVIEEKVENDARLMIGRGLGDRLRGWIKDLETPEHKLLADDSEQALVEGYSRVVTSYSLVKRKELSELGLDVLGRNRLGEGFRGVLRNYRAFFGEVFKRSLALRKGMKDGKLSPELEVKLRESLGLREGAAVDVESSKMRRAPVVVGTKMSFALGDSPLKKAETFLRENVVSKPITTLDGLTATVSNTTAGKMTSGKAVRKSASFKAHLAAIADIVELFEAGEIDTDTHDRKGDKNLTAIRRVHSPMLFEGKEYTVKFTVKEIQQKDNRIYSIEAMDLATTSAGQSAHDTEAARGAPLTDVVEDNSNATWEESQAEVVEEPFNYPQHFPFKPEPVYGKIQIHPKIRKWFKGWGAKLDDQGFPPMDEWGFPNIPKTLPDDSDLLRVTDEKETIKLPSNHPLVETGILPADTTMPRVDFKKAVVAYFMKQGVQIRDGVKPRIFVFGGGGGAGKSTVIKDLRANGYLPQTGAIEINPDDIMLLIPEYVEMVRAGDGRAAGLAVKESAIIANLLRDEAVASGKFDIIYDSTLSNEKNAKKWLKSWRSQGFEINLIGVVIEPYVAMVRASVRSRDSGRWVPNNKLAEAHRDFNAALKKYIPLVDSMFIYDNTGDEHILIAGKKSLENDISIVDSAAWDNIDRYGR